MSRSQPTVYNLHIEEPTRPEVPYDQRHYIGLENPRIQYSFEVGDKWYYSRKKAANKLDKKQEDLAYEPDIEPPDLYKFKEGEY